MLFNAAIGFTSRAVLVVDDPAVCVNDPAGTLRGL